MINASKPYPHSENHRAIDDWNPLWEQFRELDPDFLEAHFAFRSRPQSRGRLAQKYKLSSLMEEVSKIEE